MEQIRHINRCNTLQDRAVLTEDGSFCVPCLMETGIMKTRSERKGRHIQPLTDRRTTGQSWQTPLFGRQGRALRVSGKNHPRPEGLRYFSHQAIISRPPMAPVQIPVPIPARRKYPVPEPTVKFPPRERSGPVHISTLLDPVLEICSHPDRNRLLAEFFNR